MMVRLDERIPPRQKEFSEVESRIRRTVEKNVKKEIMDKWLETLKVEHKFQIYPDRLPEVAQEEEAKEAAEEEASQEPAEAEMEESQESAEEPGTTAEEQGTEEEESPSEDSEE
jgi:hypothetical protein